MATSSAGSSSSHKNVNYNSEQDGEGATIGEMYQHAMELYHEKRYEDAVRVLTAILQENGQTHEIYHARGQCYVELHNYSKAISDLRRATELHPDSSNDQQRALAHFYLHVYGLLDSEPQSGSSASFGGNQGLSSQAWCCYNRALSSYYLSQYAKAIEDFSVVLREAPGFAAGFRCRGTAYLHLGRFSEAIVDLLESSRLERCATTFYNLGLAYGNQQQFELAVKNFTQAISLNANDAATYSNRGISYKSLRQYEAAIADFSTALNLNPGSASAFDHRGQCHLELGNHAAAKEDFSSSLQITITAPRHARRATAKYQLGLTADAVQDLDAAIALTKNHNELAQYYLTRAKYLLNSDQVQAEVDFSKALSHSPNAIEALYARSAVRRLLKDSAGADADLKLAQRLDNVGITQELLRLMSPI